MNTKILSEKQINQKYIGQKIGNWSNMKIRLGKEKICISAHEWQCAEVLHVTKLMWIHLAVSAYRCGLEGWWGLWDANGNGRFWWNMSRRVLFAVTLSFPLPAVAKCFPPSLSLESHSWPCLKTDHLLAKVSLEKCTENKNDKICRSFYRNKRTHARLKVRDEKHSADLMKEWPKYEAGKKIQINILDENDINIQK